jgi:hypothetical protein
MQKSYYSSLHNLELVLMMDENSFERYLNVLQSMNSIEHLMINLNDDDEIASHSQLIHVDVV